MENLSYSKWQKTEEEPQTCDWSGDYLSLFVKEVNFFVVFLPHVHRQINRQDSLQPAVRQQPCPPPSSPHFFILD